MRFIGAFVCDKCGKEFTLDFGPQKMGELKTRTKLCDFIGTTAAFMAQSCREHEKGCDPSPPRRDGGGV